MAEELEVKDKVTFRAFVSGYKTISSEGGYTRITLDLFEKDLATACALPYFFQKNIQAALIIIPDEE